MTSRSSDIDVSAASLSCWMALHAELLAGLAHDVAGRTSALQSLALVGRKRPPHDAFVLDELESEAAKLAPLAEAARGFARLATVASAASDRGSFTSLVAALEALLPLHRFVDRDEVTCIVEAGTGTVGVREDELLRALLLLGYDIAVRGSVAIRAAPGPEPTSVHVSVLSSDPAVDFGDGIAALTGAAPPGDASRVETERTGLDARDVAELQSVVGSWGGLLDEVDDGWSLVLPT